MQFSERNNSKNVKNTKWNTNKILEDDSYVHTNTQLWNVDQTKIEESKESDKV